MKHRLNIDDNLLNRIISAAYGDSNFIEKFRIYLLAAKNKEVKKLLHEYRVTAKAVRRLEPEKCPEEIIEKLNSNSRNADRFPAAVSNFIYPFIYKPAVSALTAVLVISVIIFFLFKPSNRNEYSDHQVRLAEKQVKESLVLVNRVFERTAFKVENDILRDQVAKPVNKGVSTINDLFKGG
jgi:hypothetical protein